MRTSVALVALAASLITVGLGVPVAGASPAGDTSTVVVTPAALSTGWSLTNDPGSSGQFVSGPGSPPAGVGSFQLTIPSNGKATLLDNLVSGTALSEVDAVGYATYRDSSSTIAADVAPSLQLPICADGAVCSEFTTLVWEPIYAYGTAANGDNPVVANTWQTWDALGHTSTGYTGGWWSTHAIPGVCAFNCFVSLAEIQAANPNALIGSFGVNVGHGPTGTFNGAVDALTLGLSGHTTVYDLEPGPQTVAFTSTPPSPAYYGASYAVAATGSGSAPVGFAIDPASSAVCSISGATVRFTGVGVCTIDATQPGDATHAAGQAQQSVHVVAAPVSVSGSTISRFSSLFAQRVNVAVTVKSGATGSPAVGVLVTVTVRPAVSFLEGLAVSCTATTNSSGVATCSLHNSAQLLFGLLLSRSYQIGTQATTDFQSGSGTGGIS